MNMGKPKSGKEEKPVSGKTEKNMSRRKGKSLFRRKEGKARYRYVFRTYNYTECDEFALFLEKMAGEGWELDSWPGSLIFRKTAPQEIVYSVEVFPKGSENDTRPAPDTEEFADYCEAAGWKLVDSRRKFCIFRKVRVDAVPIVAEEERFSNIAKAEGGYRIRQLIAWTICAVIFLIEGLTIGFPAWFFLSSNLFSMVFYIALSIYSLVRLIQFFVWRHRTCRTLEAGDEVWYGSHGKIHPFRRPWLWTILLCAILIYIAIPSSVRGGVSGLIPYVLFSILAVLFVYRMIEVGRPSRHGKVALEIATPFYLLVVVGLIIFIGTAGNAGTSETGASGSGSGASGEAGLSGAPLVPSDYAGAGSSMIRTSDYGQTRSVLGTWIHASIRYGEGESYGDEGSYGDLEYDIYESRCSLLMDGVWNRMKKRYFEKESAEAGTSGTNAEETGTTGEKDSGGHSKAYWEAITGNGDSAWDSTVDSRGVAPPDSKEGTSADLWQAEQVMEKEAFVHIYLVRYPESILLLQTYPGLSDEEIAVIREKLDLK